MHLKIIACEVLAREVYYCAARAAHTTAVELITQGLHDNPDIGRARLQALMTPPCPTPTPRSSWATACAATWPRA